jgi:hypothetical protein
MNPDPGDEKIRRLHRLRRLLLKMAYQQVARDLSTSETWSVGHRREATTEPNLRNLSNLRILSSGFGMKLVCGLLLFLILASGAAQAQIGSPSPVVPIADTRHPYEYILLCGGPSLHLWEQYKNEPHDNYWGCFVRAARTRLQELRPVIKDNASATVTMLIYLDGYRSRSAQEKRDLIPLIYSVRDAYRLNLVPIESGEDVIRYLNAGQPRQQIKIADFEYFGHSNQDAFMFDYSNQVGSSSKSWLHQNQLAELHRGLFAAGAYVKSWGCYTGESMSQKFRAATGVPMVGAVGKVDYSNREDALNGIVPVLSSVGGRWTR